MRLLPHGLEDVRISWGTSTTTGGFGGGGGGGGVGVVEVIEVSSSLPINMKAAAALEDMAIITTTPMAAALPDIYNYGTFFLVKDTARFSFNGKL